MKDWIKDDSEGLFVPAADPEAEGVIGHMVYPAPHSYLGQRKILAGITDPDLLGED